MIFPFILHKLHFTSPFTLFQCLLIPDPSRFQFVPLRNNHQNPRATHFLKIRIRTRVQFRVIIRTRTSRVQELDHLIGFFLREIRMQHDQPTDTQFCLIDSRLDRNVMGQVGPSTLSHQKDPTSVNIIVDPRVGSRPSCMGGDPLERHPAVVVCGWERVLRGQPVANCNCDCGGLGY
ncbi:hypothetical protein HanRHA438_Chr03g0121851 [Helianthus annuus]|nr:hypothetical protein HanRHA438_Chr03g0121851 [Helianthus annuus]